MENRFETDRKEENLRVVEAKTDRQKKESFLADSQDHIIRLTSVILKRTVTKSDDEYSVALIATSDAIDSYDPERNDFWSYAAYVIRNRLVDHYRKESGRKEIPVSPGAFEGNAEEDAPDLDISLEVRDNIKIRSLGVNNTLKDEIAAFEGELKEYGITMTDLVGCSPKSQKTRKGCADIIQAIFLPPSLVGFIKENGKIPATELLTRAKLQKKLMERHRKYLIAATVILSGDYPKLSEYVKYLKPSVDNIISFEERRSGS